VSRKTSPAPEQGSAASERDHCTHDENCHPGDVDGEVLAARTGRQPNEDGDTMQSSKAIGTLLALTICVCPCFASEATEITFKSGQIVLETVGQVNNSGSNSVQFGYAARVASIGNAFSTNASADQNESTARFTFYTEVVNRRVTTNGPLTIIVREGTTTLYLNSSPASFGSLDSFRSGTPFQTSVIHQQVIVDTVEKTFTVVKFKHDHFHGAFLGRRNRIRTGRCRANLQNPTSRSAQGP
jgi:hypothetical protein